MYITKLFFRFFLWSLWCFRWRMMKQYWCYACPILLIFPGVCSWHCYVYNRMPGMWLIFWVYAWSIFLCTYVHNISFSHFCDIVLDITGPGRDIVMDITRLRLWHCYRVSKGTRCRYFWIMLHQVCWYFLNRWECATWKIWMTSNKNWAVVIMEQVVLWILYGINPDLGLFLGMFAMLLCI